MGTTPTYTNRSEREFIIGEVSDHGATVTLTSTERSAFNRAASDLGRTIAVGEHLALETRNYSTITGLRDVNGWLFRLTDEELDAKHAEFVADMKKRDRERLEQNRETWQSAEDALPEWLSARLTRFHTAGGEHFALEGWGYELAICQLAEAYAADDQARADELDVELGCSGNQHDCARALATIHNRGDSIDHVIAGLAPITGSADYSPRGVSS